MLRKEKREREREREREGEREKKRCAWRRGIELTSALYVDFLGARRNKYP